ncbi:hypothetical protein [Rhizobium sp. BK176]|uniref:hypothetical protein n=1 Tax=Rhizobium sp. BK176 TaxID=2587071 RepID=UPI0021695BF7|nr:hypothetical protein [Rhizobium sp. BK176]MCS4089335.1 hypothetical protein [Rhizobium sp. BK176]
MCSDEAELARLTDAVRFTLSDHQRLLRKSDVEGICHSTDLCFEYSAIVRCGPCAVKQAAEHGVTVIDDVGFSADVCRLRRRLTVTETDVGSLREALRQVVQDYDAKTASPTELRDVIGENVVRYRELSAHKEILTEDEVLVRWVRDRK